ncbi:MAG: zf-TFIIB domain-containing protein [Candidatus Palauibacterales bacterium]|nr:zf-TFIIB domain-containing protein [Candidatus Palauibacterales bacterium]
MEWRIYSRTGRVFGAALKEPALVQTMHGAVGAEAGDYLVVDLDCERIRYYPARFFHRSYQVVERPVPLKALADLSRMVVRHVVDSGAESIGETCVRCGKRRTRAEFEGVPTCLDCELKLKAEREETLVCQHDGTAMRKEVIQNVIVDRCPECGGVWFDGGELEVLGAAFRRATDFGMPAELASRMIHGLVERDVD